MKYIVPAKFVKIEENHVVLDCNVGNMEHPHIQVRRFAKEPFGEMIKGWDPEPQDKYLTINIDFDHENNTTLFTYELVEDTPAFRRNFRQIKSFIVIPE